VNPVLWRARAFSLNIAQEAISDANRSEPSVERAGNSDRSRVRSPISAGRGVVYRETPSRIRGFDLWLACAAAALGAAGREFAAQARRLGR